MSAQAKPTIIGAFVAGALALLVLSLFVLGNGRWFSDKQEFIIYFPESVNGLAVGAPVKFRGVKIGEVSRILIHYNQPKDNLSIPVIISVDYSLIDRNYAAAGEQVASDSSFVRHVSAGLRAKLEFQSFVTGVRYVELGYYKDDGPLPKPVQIEQIYPEIPALESTTSDLMKAMTQTIKNISEIDFPKLASSAGNVLSRLQQGLDEIQFKQINNQLVSLLDRADKSLQEIDFKQLNQRLQTLLGNADGIVSDPGIKEAIVNLNTALKTANTAFSTLNGMIRPDSVLNFQLDNALGEMSEAARAFRQLAEFLDRNPSALILGRAQPSPDMYGPSKEKKYEK